MTTATEAGGEEKCRRLEFGISCLEPVVATAGIDISAKHRT